MLHEPVFFPGSNGETLNLSRADALKLVEVGLAYDNGDASETDIILRSGVTLDDVSQALAKRV